MIPVKKAQAARRLSRIAAVSTLLAGGAFVFALAGVPVPPSSFSIPAARAADAPGPDASPTGIPLPSALGGDVKASAAEPSIRPPDAVDPMSDPRAAAAAASAPAEDPTDPLAWSGGKSQPAGGSAAPATAPSGTGQPDQAPPLSAGTDIMAPATPASPTPLAPAPDLAAGQPQPATPAIAAPQQQESPPQPAAATPAGPGLAALESRIAALEGQVHALETLKSELDGLKQSVADLRNRKAPDAAAEKPAPAVKAAGAVKSHPHAAQPKKTKAVRSKWQLKSAKPGMAWLAEPGSSELRAVAVGETLPGIGKIVSISTDASGKWVVTGAHGKISQP